MVSSDRRVLEEIKLSGGRTLAFVVDQLAGASVNATRASWWISGPEELERRVTVSEAIENYATSWLDDILPAPDDVPSSEVEQTIADVWKDSAEAIFLVSFTWLVTPLFSLYPDLGGAARPFWKQIVEAAERYPEALAQVHYDSEMHHYNRRQQEP